MLQAVEAEIDKEGKIRLKERIRLKKPRKAIVIILDDSENTNDTALLSELSLAEDWNRQEEEEAWAKFQ